VAVSHDGGATFAVQMLSGPFDVYALFPLSLDALPGGRVVAAWVAPEEGTQTLRIHLRESQDAGATWSAPRVVRVPGSAQQPWVALRPDGLLAVAYYGTDREGPLPAMGQDTPWGPRVVFLDGTREVAQADLAGGATFRGVLCNQGASCPDGAPSQTPMHEFLSAAWGPDGTLHVAFVDARDTAPAGATPQAAKGRVTVTGVHVSAPLG
jgi:hypothetical protein